MEEVREEKVEEVSTAPAKKKHKVRIKRNERCMRNRRVFSSNLDQATVATVDW